MNKFDDSADALESRDWSSAYVDDRPRTAIDAIVQHSDNDLRTLGLAPSFLGFDDGEIGPRLGRTVGCDLKCIADALDRLHAHRVAREQRQGQ